MLTPNAEKLLKQRYYKPGEDWAALVKRNVDAIALENKSDYYDLIYNRVFLPNSPSLVNAGSKTGGLFACFTVGPTADTLEDSFNTLTDIALVAKKGGGCGFSGSILRAKNSPVAGSAHGYAYGPNRFAQMVSYAMDAITQSGFRKMALMYTLSAEHPDIEDFIHLKQSGNEQECYNFNQSLFIKDDWMRRAINNVGSKESKLLRLIAQHAWNNGEPGVLFETTINETSPYALSEQYIYTTNPCSEQPLPPYGSCNLASVNLAHDRFLSSGRFHYGYLYDVTKKLAFYLDWTGTVNKFPTLKHYQWYQRNRPIGIGIMGFADLLLKLGITYGSEESNELLNKIISTMYYAASDASVKMGKLYGIPEYNEDLGRRNATLLSIAPTGSIAVIADCSHGIEPIFSPSYIRVDERGEEYLVTNPHANQPYFVSAVGANQPTWQEQIELVSTAQLHVDSGISKTINLPNSATIEDVQKAIVFAWQTGCNGVTLYRDGSREVQVLNNITELDVMNAECKDGVCSL